MKAIKNFDENVYILQDESGKYYIMVNGKKFDLTEARWLIVDIENARQYVMNSNKDKS